MKQRRRMEDDEVAVHNMRLIREDLEDLEERALGPKPLPSLERIVVGALRAAIRDHGPITLCLIGSAAKRIVGQLAGAVGPAAMARRRWAETTEEERAQVASKGGRTAWAAITPEQRSEEMRRRAAKRRPRRPGTRPASP